MMPARAYLSCCACSSCLDLVPRFLKYFWSSSVPHAALLFALRLRYRNPSTPPERFVLLLSEAGHQGGSGHAWLRLQALKVAWALRCLCIAS
jgi:hypothetical protein